MITKLSIRNFKSIQQMELSPTRVNVFIGEPNVGKSNILESLGLLSFVPYGEGNLKDFVRHESLSNLFYDDILDDPVRIEGTRTTKKGGDDPFELQLGLNDTEIRAVQKQGRSQDQAFTANFSKVLSHQNLGYFSFVKFYRYQAMEAFPTLLAECLWPPNGSNLFSLVKARSGVREYLVELFKGLGYRVNLKVQDHKIEMAKDTGEVLYSYPYVTISDTLKHIIFYVTAIKSNRDSTLVFEEPESNSFPFYTMELAERIGQDEGDNQYFMTTHNPYFLEPLVEKTPRDELSVFLVHSKGYATRIKRLSEDAVAELVEMDPFLNLDRFLQ
jgi:predicted ATPase